MQNQVDPFLFAFAPTFAQGHADAALLQFNKLQAVFHAQKQLPTRSHANLLELARHALPAATLLAFALELKLKVNYFQNFCAFPGTHDLKGILSKIPDKDRSKMFGFYRLRYSSNIPLEIVEYFLFSPPESETSSVKPRLNDFDSAINFVSTAYVKWRYIYETLSTPASLYINFKSLLCLIEAVDAAIDTHVGNAQFKFQ